jgi:hypothetical protein
MAQEGKRIRRLAIYDEVTGQYIDLQNKVYLILLEHISDDALDRLEKREAGVPESAHIGWRLDEFNMTNLFFME